MCSNKFESLTLGGDGVWVKTGLHCHSDHSDGGLSPENTVEEYRSQGFQCVAITDHRMVTPIGNITTGSMITIDGVEVGGQPDILGIGVTDTPDPSFPFYRKARILSDQGAFTIGAHPTYSAALPEVYLDCGHLMALEIYNAYCEEAYGNGISTELWDMLLGSGRRIWGVASDDAHLNPEKRYFSSAGRAWVEIWTRERSPAHVLDSLKQGRFYSTCGPKFTSIEANDSGIEIECTPVKSIRWRTRGPCGHVEYSNSQQLLTKSRLPQWFSPRGYVRIEIVDDKGRKAWSNPLFIEE